MRSLASRLTEQNRLLAAVARGGAYCFAVGQRFMHRLRSQPGADLLQGLNARQWDERLTPSLPLMTDLVRGDAGISAGLARGALRCLGLGRAAAETCAHKLLAGVALHAASG